MWTMRGFLLVRVLFVAVVVYAAALIGPIDGHPSINAGLGLVVALLIVVAEARLRDTSVTRLLGGLLGFGVGLMIAKAIGSALFWADTERLQSPVPARPHHRRAAVSRPGARRAAGRVARAGEVRVAVPRRAPAEAVSHSRHQRHHRRPRRRCRRDRVSRRHARRAAVRAEGAAIRRRFVRSAEAQPRPPRPRHPASHSEDGRRRGRHLGPRLSRKSRKST